MFQWIQPNIILDSVLSVTPEFLRARGITSLLLDIDSTLKSYKAAKIPEATLCWLESLAESGIGVCLLSNGRKHRIQPIAESLKLPFIAPAMKPLPFGCFKAIKIHGFDARSTAIVGDQVFADILAGKFAKITTILVTPIKPEEENWYTRIKRPFEKWVLVRKAGEDR